MERVWSSNRQARLLQSAVNTSSNGATLILIVRFAEMEITFFSEHCVEVKFLDVKSSSLYDCLCIFKYQT